MLSKLIDKIKSYQYHIFLAICILLISFVSFNLGKLASNEKGSIRITEGGRWKVDGGNLTAEVFQASDNTPHSTLSPPKSLDLRVVASKKSKTKLYHFVWCPGQKRIKEENKLWFNNEQEAIQIGYKLAGNCTK